jgi:hypothetical protein
LHGGGGEFALGFFADLGFEIRIGRAEESCVARIDASFSVVDARAEHFGGREMDGDVAAVNCDVGGLKFGEINPADGFPMNNQEQSIACEDVREIWIVVLAGNYFVHGVADGFEALELLNLADDGGLIDVKGDAAAREAKEIEQVHAGDEPYAESDDGERGEYTEDRACESR